MRTNSRIQESRENYFYNSATEENENLLILNFVKVPNSEIQENLNTQKLPDLQ